MSALLRILACLLGIVSPSLMMFPRPVDRSWLDRWERRIQNRHREAACRLPPIEWRDEVQIVETRSGHVVSGFDVSGRSDRARRRVINKWRRRTEGTGYDVRTYRGRAPASTV